ncbi:hypothetical protein NX059_001203 [Plenodomus lindquistii]|nr:hypothetical protein NX059_001203 [Plenodomus lindquistii]
MRSLRGVPHIATLHDGLEYNRRTETLSFFMDYYKGKDLDRQIQMLRGAAEKFSESQIVEIGFQIAEALEFCHSRNILHQDMKPMNVLLRESWNPITQRDVPDLYLADFGIASYVQTLGTRITAQRGTPGYEAPEIRGQGYEAAFSQKSDIYAFGCVLHRLCTLEQHGILDDVKPCDISADYSMELLGLISSMLSADRDERPTATNAREQFAAIGMRMFTADSLHCLECHETFPSRNQLTKHLKITRHKRPSMKTQANNGLNGVTTHETGGLKIRGVAEAPTKVHYEESTLEVVDPSPCVVCMRYFNSKKHFFGHIHGANHYRGPKQVAKRRAENRLSLDVERRDKRFGNWAQKDLDRHD